MKRILFLLMALLTGVSGAWAKTELAYNALTTGVDYVLADNSKSWFLVQGAKTGCVIENNKYQLVATGTDGQYYLKQSTTNMYIAKSGGNNTAVEWTSDQGNAEAFTIDRKDDDYQVRFVPTSKTGIFFNSQGNSNNSPIWFNGTGPWSYWYVYTYEDAYADFVATLPQLTTDVSSPKYYSIKSYNRGGYLTSNGAGQGLTHVDFTNGAVWYFTAADGNTSGNATGGVVAHCYDGTQMTTSWTTAATGGTIYILANNVNGNGFSICKNASISGNDCCDANNTNTGVGTWSPRTNDWEGTTWVFEPTIPSGYYYFKGMATGRYPYLYSDFVGKSTSATYHHSPLAGKNGEIWKVTNNGGTLTATNGEGLPIIIGENSYGTLTIGSAAVGPDFYFTQAINLTDLGNDTQLTTWTAGGSGAPDNRWTFESADVSAGVYNVVVEGNDDGYVTYNGQNAKNGGFFVAASIAEDDLTVHEITDYTSSVTIDGNTITLTYQHTISYTLTDANGAKYSGSYSGVVGEEPEFTGCAGYTLSDITWEGTSFTATISFPFSVSTPTFIGSFHNKNGYPSDYYLWHADGTNVIVHYGDLPSTDSDEQNKYKWEIEPAIDGLNITFKIKNVNTGTYINSTATSSDHSNGVSLSETATPLTYTLRSKASNMFITTSTFNAWYIPSTSLYLSVNSATGPATQKLGVFATDHDGLSIGFHTYADLITVYWAKNEIEALIAKTGSYGYPTTTNVDYSYLAWAKGSLSRGKLDGTAENYTNIVNWHQGYLNPSEVVTPAINKFYRFKGYLSGKYLRGTADTESRMYNNITEADNTTTVFYLNEDSKLISYTNGRYAINTNYLNTTGYDGHAYTFAKSENNTLGALTVKDPSSAGGKYLYSHNDNTEYANRNGATHNNTDWIVEDVEQIGVTISSVGYATLYAPVALTIPEGVTAYVAADKGDYLSMTQVSTTIPANTGVILAGEAGTYNFAITTGGSVESNVLTGTVAAISRPDGSYILATGSNGVGFYADGASTIPGFKAYLPSSANVRGFLGFNFDEQTAITAIEAAQNPGKTVYDLNGRRVENPAKGLYIVNGKKVIINK